MTNGVATTHQLIWRKATCALDVLNIPVVRDALAVEVNNSTFGNIGASYKLGSLGMQLVTLLDERTPRGNVLNQNLTSKQRS